MELILMMMMVVIVVMVVVVVVVKMMMMMINRIFFVQYELLWLQEMKMLAALSQTPVLKVKDNLDCIWGRDDTATLQVVPLGCLFLNCILDSLSVSIQLYTIFMYKYAYNCWLNVRYK